MTETKETPAAETEATVTPTTATPEPTDAQATASTPVEAGNENGTPASENGAETNGDAADEEKPEPPKEMRAIVLTGFGGLKGVKVLQKPEPTAQAGEVLIRVKAW